MIRCKTGASLNEVLGKIRSKQKAIAFVPTMGALHDGHLQLIRNGKAEGAFVVSSIFVNPTQFNDPEDLKKYPRPLEKDIQLLASVDCDLLFLPSVEEMYGENETWSIDLGTLDEVLEGRHRPGHFQGVTQIVYKLFERVKPDIAYFGQKDL